MFYPDGAALAMEADFARQRREHRKSQPLRFDAHVHAWVRHLAKQSATRKPRRKAKP